MMANASLEFLFNHVFLPPRVPHADDTQDGKGDNILMDRLTYLVELFRERIGPSYYQEWSDVCKMLRKFARLHSANRSLSRALLKSAFRDVEDGEILVLHIAIQNSGLIIRKHRKEYVFESFEASPPAAEVLAAEKALQWDFPSRAVAISATTFEDASFQDNLTEFLERASTQPVKQFAATTFKASSLAYESRDTPTPAIIGQLLMALLEANGRRQTATLTRKRIHDEVCWSDGAQNPWRRSAVWLVLRVGLQRALCFLLDGSLGTFYYKTFMCFVLSSLANDFLAESSVASHQLAFVRTKLARRVAKLQKSKDSITSEETPGIGAFFSSLERELMITVNSLNKKLREDWASIRSRTTKKISRLPARANQADTTLSLWHSRALLQRILNDSLYERQAAPFRLEHRSRKAAQHTWSNFENSDPHSVCDFLIIADFESQLHAEVSECLEDAIYSDRKCVELMNKMRQYQSIATSAYRSDPEQLSLMVVNLLEIWQALDSTAVVLYPLLAEYEPGLPQDLLYSLQVAEYADMQRVQTVEKYIESRYNHGKLPFHYIFNDPSRESFSVRFFDSSREMQELLCRITLMDNKAKSEKEVEWRGKSTEYETLLRQADQTACLYIEDEFEPLRRQHDDRRCRKHFLQRQANRIKIPLHESMLPSDDVHARAVVFELLLPEGFAAWRDSTWQLRQLGQQHLCPDRAPQVSLRDYSPLRPYVRHTGSSIALASRTKSFYSTHYAHVPLPTSLDRICVPHGLKYGLYDNINSIWTSRHSTKPSFSNLCAQSLPTRSVYAPLSKYLHPTFEDKGAFANEIFAGQTRCPNTLTIAEFIAFQTLRLGTRLQWVRLLRELSSPNLNLGTAEVGSLIQELALVTGHSERRDTLRDTHWVFLDPSFCKALAAQVRQRLEAVAANWREGQTVECLVTLLQRLWSLTRSPEIRKEAEELLIYVRTTTHEWTRLLRREICNTGDTETTHKRSKDALLAALLCRKTFLIEAAKPNDHLQADALACFLECSFILKENLPSSEPGYISKMPTNLRKLFVSDIKLVHRLEAKLRLSIQVLQSGVDEAVNSVWVEAKGQSSRKYSPWTFLPGPHPGWISAQSINAEGLPGQSVHFDMYEGTLLIDGQPLGRLPDDYTKQEFFQGIFGNRVFMTYPSDMRGMSYMLAGLFEGLEVHFGFRDGNAFMRVRSLSRILELLPPGIFFFKDSGHAPDLPFPLIDGHVHWLDLANHRLEIRPRSTMWQTKKDDWRIDLRTNQASGMGTSLLVDPSSAVFKSVANVIEPFEDRRNIIMFQPQKKNLLFSLPRLELSFGVNSAGLPESQQLRAFIDSNQDAGTLYGLASSLVVCDITEPEHRSIIATMGSVDIKQQGYHVKAQINHNGYYARFFINNVLGRLECAPEPRLIYFKAYCHAITSFIEPDPLTKRTGTNEALHCLQAGNAQPWAPLDETAYGTLSRIAALTPQRIYYPEDLKLLQQVIWEGHIMPQAQHDDYRPIAMEIVLQCELLNKFHLTSTKPLLNDRRSDQHLLLRAQLRNQAFRANQNQQTTPIVPDRKYIARDCANSVSATNAFEAASLLKQWSHHITVNPNLAASLQEWPLIQGYAHDFELYLLGDLINIDFASNWGSLFKLCQRTVGPSERFKLMFLFATMSFDKTIDMSIVRSLIAVSVMEQFNTLELPKCHEFEYFRFRQIPSFDLLVQLIQPYRVPYPEDERALLSVTMHSKQRRKLEMAENKHEQLSESSCMALARFFLAQWPKRELSLDGRSDLLLLDVESAYLSLKPEWERLYDNYELSQHLTQVQGLLQPCRRVEALGSLSFQDNEQRFFAFAATADNDLTIQHLLCKPAASFSPNDPKNSVTGHVRTTDDWPKNGPLSSRVTGADSKAKSHHSSFGLSQGPPNVQNKLPDTNTELQSIIGLFAGSEDPVRQFYGLDLQRSMDALIKSQPEVLSESPSGTNTDDFTGLETTVSSSEAAVQNKFDSIRKALVQDSWWLEAGRMLPDITPVTLLETLRMSKFPGTSSIPYDNVRSYGESIRMLQHLLRVRSALKRADTIELAKETQDDVGTVWPVENHVDWLLLEIDFNILIRREQHDVAQAMISSRNTANFVLQLMMGKGKSSVIIPMVVSHLADKKSLVRVAVPRALLQQTAQLLQGRLGGLLGRKVKHIPFSRKSPTEVSDIKVYHEIHRDVLLNQGVILTLPEHVLSFQLSGLQQLSNGRIQQADFMLKVQNWFARKCRDILDECDHMLAVKTQLIYPSGAQSTVDGHPNRWKVVQVLLKLVKMHLRSLLYRFPKSIQVIKRSPGTFPTIHFLNDDVKNALMEGLTDSAIKGEAGILPIASCSPDELDAIYVYLRNAQLPKATALKVTNVFKDKPDARQQLLLLRGLLIHRILLMGLSKRWNVQYGIHPQRDPIAVPFRSKGIPSDQAEFGHPDVSILLTCLSFYYSGLTVQQFQQNLHLLRSADEPLREYESWITDIEAFPDSLRSWSSINVDDEAQCTQLWNYLRQQMTVINFFLNHFVFPRHARTFERKLVSSGWDIALPLAPSSNEPCVALKENRRPLIDSVKRQSGQPSSLTVGFSGTNDNKILLPLNILQNDLPGLLHTNAEVLRYLLEERNRRYRPISDKGLRISERAFLRVLQRKGIRMLLDAGAQILELDNISLARTWLEEDLTAEGAVFFGEDGWARIIYRDNKVQPLATSPYVNNLGACCTYFPDNSHILFC